MNWPFYYNKFKMKSRNPAKCISLSCHDTPKEGKIREDKNLEEWLKGIMVTIIQLSLLVLWETNLKVHKLKSPFFYALKFSHNAIFFF